MIKHRQIAAAVLCLAALLGRAAWGDAFDPPAGYYDSATGTGATLKGQLNNIIDSFDDPGITDILHTPISYDAARSALQITDDATPNNLSDDIILLVYDRVSLNVASLSGPPAGWDFGVSWDREHTWPQSRGLNGTGMPDGSDLHALRPSTPSVNSDRGNSNFGGVFGAQSFGDVSDGGAKWYPGDADAGMIARQQFYMAVRYDASDAGTTNLELAAGNPAEGGTTLGDLNRLIEWHFAAPPDSFERRRNQVIYADYQDNRNPFIDRPEFVWSVFAKDINGNSIPNNSQIAIGGTTPDANGGSTRNVNLGRVFAGSAVPAAQAFTLSKAGTDGTYCDVTTAGAATSSIAGRFNAFRTNQIDNKMINVGLSTNAATTAMAGLQSGTVTIDNLDVTSGLAGRGANDANDVFNVSLTVLDHATPSFSGSSVVTALPIDFGTVTTASATQSLNFDVFNRGTNPVFTANMDFDSVLPSGDTTSLTTNAAALAGSLVLAGGAGQTFTAMLSTLAVGSFSATYTLQFSDENIAGALNSQIVLTLTGTVLLAGDFNRDGVVDAADYVVWRKTDGTSTTAYSGADGDGNGTIDGNDLSVWQQNFGAVASGSGGGSDQVPEPAGAMLVMVGLAVVCRYARSRKS